MSWNDNQSKIVINGIIPLQEYIEAVERSEKQKKDNQKRKEILSEVFGEIPLVKGSIYFKPRKVGTLVTKVLNSRVYDIKDQIRYLLSRSGHTDLFSAFAEFSPRKKHQIERLLKIFRKIKDKEFYLVDAIKWLKSDICVDPQRDLLMLQQAGILIRDESSGYVIYRRECNTDVEALVLLITNSKKMVGYVNRTRITCKQSPTKQSGSQQIPAESSVNKRQESRVDLNIQSLFDDLKSGYKGGDIERYVRQFMLEKFKS